MLYLQILLNGLLLGGLYALIAVGFSLVWGVLNVINILHGTFIVLGSYIAYFTHLYFGIHPFASVIISGSVLFCLGYVIQAGIINRVIAAPVLMTLTLTFGLDLLLNNAMLIAFTADYRKLILTNSLGSYDLWGLILPLNRVAGVGLAALLTFGLYRLLRDSNIGRAIVAVRMDREAATLMGVRVNRINAVTFALGALMAGAAGSIFSIVYPISPINSGLFLGKAFVICILGGLGSVPGAMIGGIALGVIESYGALFFGPEHATTLAFVILIALLIFRPTGIMGRKGYE
jgi:branched-chain amino acid transport system permease protein